MDVKMPNKTLLLTGFEALLGEKINPSALAVKEFLQYTIPDNEGNKPRYIKITEDKQDGYFATIPVEKIVEMIKKSNIPAMLSYSAGTFCCNELFYGASHYIRNNNLKIANGFIYTPFTCEQVIDSPRPSMPLSTIIEGISIAIAVITRRV
jgi:pyroglutamyl-peptidase